MKNRILSLLLVVLLAIGTFACAASAEEASAINLYDTSLTVGGKTYTFPISVADLTAMGVSVPDVTGLTEGKYYYDVPVDDGRNAFSVRVDYVTTTEDPFWATGVNLNSDKHAGQSVGGLVLGETTMKDVVDAWGPDEYGYTFERDYLTYFTFGNHYSWHLYFESASENAKLTRLTMDNDLVTDYGVVDTSKTGVQEENLPDPASLPFDSYILDGKLYQKGATVQDLLDNGWVLPADHPADTAVEGSGFHLVSGDRMYMYNGVGLIYVGAFNYGGEECTLAECAINRIKASVRQNGPLLCADGIQPGVTTLSEAAATLGTPSKDSTYENGVRTVEFEVLNGVTYELTVDADERVTAIAIGGLQG
ncbi:MAG: hypothetical protein ACI4MF_12385 [Candidatus Faecivicinus sp.]